jgi:hypothetical protein
MLRPVLFALASVPQKLQQLAFCTLNSWFCLSDSISGCVLRCNHANPDTLTPGSRDYSIRRPD